MNNTYKFICNKRYNARLELKFRRHISRIWCVGANLNKD